MPARQTRNARLALSWVLQVIVAVILCQTLFFKFSAAPESVYIFTKLGMEPWGRIGSGAAELAAAIMLLFPKSIAWGALLSVGIITGAIVSHLAILGIVVHDDGGLLFVLALIVFVASIIILALRRGDWRGAPHETKP